MRIGYDDTVGWVRAFARTIADHKDELTALDAAIGDADHGINMDRGMQAVVAKLDDAPVGDIGALFKLVGMTLVSTVGGAGGPLYGTLFLQLAGPTSGMGTIDAEGWGAGLAAAADGVRARGKAEVGDKTMIDALVPARDAFAASVASGDGFAEALAASADAAQRGMEATVPLLAKKGRASYLGERSIGHQDPGATSTALLLRTAADTWGAR